MITYSKSPLSFFQLFKNCFAGYWPIAKNFWWLIIISSVLHVITGELLKVNVYFGYVSIVIMLLAIAFFYILLLDLSNAVLSNGSFLLKSSLQIAKKRYLSVWGGYIVLFAIVAILAIVIFSFTSLTGLLTPTRTIAIITNVFTLLVGIFAVFVIFLFFFALPLIVIDQKPVFKSFEESAKLMWLNRWQPFGILLIINLFLLLVSLLGVALIPSPQSVLVSLWSFVFNMGAYPLALSTTLMVLRDLKLRSSKVSNIKVK